MISHSKKPTPKKKKSMAIPDNVRKKALEALQKLRRAEEANVDGMVKCISCGKLMHWKEAQGGHYISRQCHATELEPDNVWPQCPRCNGPYLKGNPIDYRINLVRKIGEPRVARLENMKLAYRGDEEAINSLTPKDRADITQTKGKVYYKEKLDSYKLRLKELKV